MIDAETDIKILSEYKFFICKTIELLESEVIQYPTCIILRVCGSKSFTDLQNHITTTD